MLYTEHRRLCFLSKSEGTITSYAACSDLRAWSHDLYHRDQYLREWMTCDVPKRIVPTSAIIECMKTMTCCKIRGRTTPSCHPECKSRKILESICVSCKAMKECLRRDVKYDKYFEQEELETSHWPCDRCLEALKTIKMFWKVIVEKVIGLYICKVRDTQVCQVESSCTVAKSWQREIIQQALIVNNLKSCSSPCESRTTLTTKIGDEKYKILRVGKNFIETEIIRPPPCSSKKSNQPKQEICGEKPSVYSNKGILACDDNRFYEAQNICRKRSSKCIFADIKSTDNSCKIRDSSVTGLKEELSDLKKRYKERLLEIEKLCCENKKLKSKLQTYSCKRSDKTSCGVQMSSKLSELIQPCDLVEKNSCYNILEPIDSEVVITLKSGLDRCSKHVSLLQVLHTTNDPSHELIKRVPCCKDEDPIDVLTRVHKTFGEVVRREMCIAMEKQENPSKFDIQTTFQTLKPKSSFLFCSTNKLCNE